MTWVAVAIVGGTLLAGKIQSNRGQKGAIGSGTAPSIEPGAELNIAPVQGTEVQDFGAATEGFAEPEIDRVAQEQELVQQLIDAGYDPKELGIAGLAFGGPLYREYGGGIGIESLLADFPIDYDLASLSDVIGLKPPSLSNVGPYQNDVVDMLLKNDYNMEKTVSNKGPFPDFETPPSYASEMFPSTSPDVSIEPDDEVWNSKTQKFEKIIGMPEVPEGQGMMAQAGEWWEGQTPDLQNAIMSAGAKVLSTALFPPEQKGSLVSTQTLPGNSARRRAAQMNIKPIVGSSFAADGGVLNRPMFMPKGGAMYGEGGPKDDLIPVMASNGEYMLSKAAVDQAGGGNHAKGIAALNAFNNAGNRRYG